MVIPQVWLDRASIPSSGPRPTTATLLVRLPPAGRDSVVAVEIGGDSHLVEAGPAEQFPDGRTLSRPDLQDQPTTRTNPTGCVGDQTADLVETVGTGEQRSHRLPVAHDLFELIISQTDIRRGRHHRGERAKEMP